MSQAILASGGPGTGTSTRGPVRAGDGASTRGFRGRTPGEIRFARFAFAPNERGLCGPDGARSLFEHARDGVVDAELRDLARGFEAAYPWLELLAGSAGRADPLDPDVVDAYWIGSPIATATRPRPLEAHLEGRFGARLRRGSAAARRLRALPGDEPPVHHSTHVLRVLPLVGLARTGLPVELVTVMGQCLVRPGRVSAIEGDDLLVLAPRLEQRAGRLALATPALERVRRRIDGHGFVDDVEVGDLVGIHWGWAADRLDAREARALMGLTVRNLAAAELP